MIKCTRCPCFQNEYKINCVPFSGNPNAEVYFLGEMAGMNEAQASKLVPSHFIGSAGKILNHLLGLANLTRDDIAVANSNRCYKANNAKPLKKELNACFIHTFNEIQEIKPKLVVLLGDIALRLALDVEGISDYRGKVLWSEKLKCNVFPTYHPMAVGYDPSKRKDIEDDFKMIPIILGEKTKELKLYTYQYFTEVTKEVEQAIDRISHSEYLSIDIESTGLNPYRDTIRIVQIGTGKEPVYIFSFSMLKTLQKDFPYLWQKLKQSLESKPIVGQTFEFDIKFLYIHLGIFPEEWYHDTCLAEFMLTGMKDNDLTSLTSKYSPESFGYDTQVNLLGGAHKVKDIDILLKYAACDVGVLPIIMKRQIKQLMKENMLWYFTNVMMPCNKVLTKMSIRGIKYDLDELSRVDEIYKKKGEVLLEKALKVKGIEETERYFKHKFNPKSSNHIKYLLLDYYKLPVLKKTKKKGPSVGKEEMAKYAEAPYKNKYCDIMEKYRGLEAMRKNFLSGVVSKLEGDTAHTKYSLHSTATGRPNSKDPNLLNIPARSEDKDIKGCLVARDGFSFIAADMSQIEIRVAAVIFDDENLIAACNKTGQDFHSSIASNIYEIPYDEFYSKYKAEDLHITDLRTAAKAVSFGVLYQMSHVALAYRLGISERRAQQFIDEYFKGFPNLAFNIEKLKKDVIKNGYVRNYFGFTRRWHYHSEEDQGTIREAVNFPIQSVAWNLVQMAMIKIDNEFGRLQESITKDGLVLQVYDSIICEVKDESINQVAEIMRGVMTNINMEFERLNRVQLLADFQIGKDLKDLKKYSF